MSTVLHRRTVNVAISASEAAGELAGAPADVQAGFFVAFAQSVLEWEHPWCFQCRSIVDELKPHQRQQVGSVLRNLLDYLDEPAAAEPVQKVGEAAERAEGRE